MAVRAKGGLGNTLAVDQCRWQEKSQNNSDYGENKPCAKLAVLEN
ncbi:hypothetical protein ES703_97975 [subsurface metagenome]